MPIEIGQELPDATFKELGPEGLRVVTLSDLTKGKKVVIFGLPGAFTPTCHAKQMPSYLENYDALKAKGVDAIACIAVNDPFVLSAWGKSLDVGDRVTILSDFDASFTKAIDLSFDGAMAGPGNPVAPLCHDRGRRKGGAPRRRGSSAGHGSDGSGTHSRGSLTRPLGSSSQNA